MLLRLRLTLFTLCLAERVSSDSSADIINSDIDAPNSGQTSLQVDHSLDDGYSFSPRGTILIHSLRTGSASLDPSGPNGGELFFGHAQKEALRSLCNRDGLYLLRVIAQDGSIHRTATHACNLVKTGLSEVLTVHLDWRNKVVGVSVSAGPLIVDRKKQGRNDNFIEEVADTEDQLDSVEGFKSKVLVQPMEMGPQPDTAAFVQRIEQEKLSKERGETKDNRSFFAKYWMYIVPVVLFLAMSSANPEAQR